MAMYKVSSTVQFVKRASIVREREVSGKAHWVPNTDVYVTDTGMVVKVELAGMRSVDLQIIVEGNRLRISGQRADGCRAPKCTFILMEINYGTFERELELPAGYDLKEAKAAYLNGFLRIDVPLATNHPESKNAKVTISS